MLIHRPGAVAACAACVALAACGLFQERYPQAVREAVSRVSPETLARHMSVLAADDKEGRETGSEGYGRAAEYVAGQFEQMGLEPAFGTSGFYQTVPFRRADIVPEESYLTLRHQRRDLDLEPYVQYYMRPNLLRESVEVTAPVVYVGHGVTAPELGHDDYAGVEVRGRIVVLFRGAPASFPHNQRAYYSSTRVKWKNLAERGAVGVIYMNTREDEERWPWERAVRHAREPAMRWIDAEGRVVDAHPEIRMIARLGREGMDALFANGPRTAEEVLDAIEEGKPGSYEMPVVVRARTVSRHASIDSPNVGAILRGRDAALKAEHVLVSGHLDHVGIGEPLDGDAIHNGAYDNASGIAVMLEMARAFADLEERPKRSLLFLAVTGEEKGLLGSDYFAQNPAVPIGSIVANINLDMVMMLHPLKDVVAFGAEHSSLIRPLEAAAGHLDIRVSPDPYPEEVIFVRSDQFSFVRQGVPALYLVPGMDAGDAAVDGREIEMEWRATIYHSPQDDLSQEFDYAAGADFARLNFLLAHRVASESRRPAWNPGDFFGDRFGRGAAGAAGGRAP